jgi:hypothetical protein
VTVKIKNYNQDKTIPGLPDTTNINDPQTRLFLDRVRQSFSELVLTVNGMQQEISPQYIANMLFSNQFFQDSLKDAVAKQYNSAARNNKNKNRQEKNLQRIIVDPPSMEINTYNGNIEYLNISYYPADVPYSQKGVTWSSSDINVATVDEDGTVTAVAVGECVITARSTYNTAFSDSADITVVYKEGTYITVSAPFAWCSTYDGTVYTEISQVESNSRAWRQSDNSVLIPPGIGEEYAKNTAAYTLVSSFEDRNYIIGEDGTVFWEDITYVPESAMEIEVWKLYDGVTDKSLWAENSNGATGRVWETASPNQLVALPDQRKYAAGGTHVANNIEASDYPYIIGTPHKTSPWGIYTSYTVESPEYLTCQYYPNGPDNAPATVKCERQFVNLTRGDYTLRCCFNASAWPGFFEEVYGSFDMYVISVGVVQLNANGECAANPENILWQDDAIEYTGGQIGEVRGVTNATKPGTLQTISAYGIGEGIYRRTGERGYVYDFIRKWVTSPCHSGEATAVYTGGESGKYYLAEEDAVNKSNALDIADKGSAAYSFTGKNGIEYYRSGVPQKSNDAALNVNVIDEEFE